jgi:hypothetical protein
MIVITFIAHDLAADKRWLDYIQLESLDELVGWLQGMGSLTFNLNKKKRILTAAGWEKCPAPVPNLIQIKSNDGNMLFKLEKIVSNEGILYEDVKHCSERIVDLVALKYDIKHIQ